MSSEHHNACHADGLEDDRVRQHNDPEARLHPADVAHRQLRADPEVLEELLTDFHQVLPPRIHRLQELLSSQKTTDTCLFEVPRISTFTALSLQRHLATLRKSLLPFTHACLKF